MKLIKRLISSFFYSILGDQETIKLKEYVKGLYRYPKMMIGRNLSKKKMTQSDILVFATHPDDEVLGLSAIINRHRLQGDRVTVVYVTNGTGRDGESWRKDKKESEEIAIIRYYEGVHGLSVLKIPKENLICLGFPDGGTHRYLKEMSKDVAFLIKKLSPKNIYVHCIEGGHNDHDLVSLVVKSVCYQFNFQNVFEWAEYSSLYSLGTINMEFLPPLPFHKGKATKIEFTKEELKLKKEMLACHESQDVSNLYTQGEIIRKANLTNPSKELIAYSKVINEKWSYLVDRYVKYIAKKRLQLKPWKVKRLRKHVIKKT